MLVDSKVWINIPLDSSGADISGDTIQVGLSRVGPWFTAEHTTTGCRILNDPASNGSTFKVVPGANTIFVKISDNPEVPVLAAGAVYAH